MTANLHPEHNPSLNLLNKFQLTLEKNGLKFTYERKYICEEVLKLKEHFDADSLYARFKKRGLRISRDTVYRTIPLLLESGIIQKSVGEGKRDFYERLGNQPHHDHLVCIRCSKFIEFHCDEIEALQEKICLQYGFQLTFHDHRLFGICTQCRERPNT